VPLEVSGLTMHEERASDSSHIQFVWRAHVEESGSFIDLAHDFWVLVFRTLHDETEVKLTGPVTESLPISYEASQVNWGIVFKAHVFIRDLPKKDMLNKSTTLPMVGKESFQLGRHVIELPTYETAEEFVDDLVRRGILNANIEIAEALQAAVPAMSVRTLQRHHKRTTGLTQSQSQQVARARRAFMLLQEGKSIVDASFEAGYADQAHMTRSLKLLAGQTPGQIIADYKRS
jgi:AraC-like DNA-binding protein